MERAKARLVAALRIYMNGVDNIPFFYFLKKENVVQEWLDLF